MLESRVQLDRLRIRWSGAHGHEHRLGPIAQRALAILRERMLYEAAGDLADRALERVTSKPIALDLALLSDEAAAARLADSLYSALRAR